MKRVFLVQVHYNKWLVVPFENGELLNNITFVQEVGKALEPIEEDIDIKVVGVEKLTPQAVEESYKEQSAQYSRWWSEESEKVRKLEAELKQLKGVVGSTCSMGESPL